MPDPVPVILFAYARPDHLRQVLRCLEVDRVPLILAYSDGAKGVADRAAVDEVRALLRAVDWCDLQLTARESNIGLGRNIMSGVTAVASRHQRFLVWEDDLVCVPGAYAWLCGALDHYADSPEVFSVAGWTHPRICPVTIGDQPYFDGRAESWVWGGYARSWKGMDEPVDRKIADARARGFSPGAYGADLPKMSAELERKNTWAARWLYHHLQHGALCVRPPWSLVEHIGFDAGATNAAGATEWRNPPLRPAPPVPQDWPLPVQHPDCRRLWRRAVPGLAGRLRRRLEKWVTRA